VPYRIGNAAFVAEFCGGPVPEGTGSGNTTVFLANSRQVLARFDIGDELRTDAIDAVEGLRSLGYRPVIASGDHAEAVSRVATRLGIGEWRAPLTPSEKLDYIRTLRASHETVIMVGDGINDAPVLAAADASVALDAGTALARASADAVSLGRGLGPLVAAAGIARRTQRIIRQNIAWAIAYNLTAVPLAISGFLAPWMAALGMSTSSLIVVLNALRLHKVDGRAAPVTATCEVEPVESEATV
jgi:Cu2+-exporting ATPase